MQLKRSWPIPKSACQNAKLLLLVRTVDSHLKFGNLEVFCSLKEFIRYYTVFVPKHNTLLDYILAFLSSSLGEKPGPSEMEMRATVKGCNKNILLSDIPDTY